MEAKGTCLAGEQSDPECAFTVRKPSTARSNPPVPGQDFETQTMLHEIFYVLNFDEVQLTVFFLLGIMLLVSNPRTLGLVLDPKDSLLCC